MINRPIDAQQLQALQDATMAPEWVNSAERLAELCTQWRQQPLVGLDTEFQRTDTFYPKPGLIQVASEGRCYLVDPLAVDDLSPLADLLRDPDVLKVLHACSEDLELFNLMLGCVPRPLFDTQTACAFLGLGLSIGYQRLLQTLFELDVEKEETRSDWLQRPLSASQCHYAAQDVAYLEAIYQRLQPALEAEGKYAWLMAECEQMLTPADTDEAKHYSVRFKQAWKLRPQQLAVLQALSVWREQEARSRDMPRNFVVHNQSLMAMASRPPASLRELSQIEQVRGRTLSKDGAVLLALVAEARNRPLADCPPPPPRPLPSTWSKRLKALKALIETTASGLNLAPELLVRRKELEALVRSGMADDRYVLPAALQGWREDVIGKPLLKLLAQL